MTLRYDVSGWWSDAAIPRKELEAGVAAADALLCLLTDKVDGELLAGAPNLRVIATMSVGADHIDLAACKERWGRRLAGGGYEQWRMQEAQSGLHPGCADGGDGGAHDGAPPRHLQTPRRGK